MAVMLNLKWAAPYQAAAPPPTTSYLNLSGVWLRTNIVASPCPCAKCARYHQSTDVTRLPAGCSLHKSPGYLPLATRHMFPNASTFTLGSLKCQSSETDCVGLNAAKLCWQVQCTRLPEIHLHPGDISTWNIFKSFISRNEINRG